VRPPQSERCRALRRGFAETAMVVDNQLSVKANRELTLGLITRSPTTVNRRAKPTGVQTVRK
jgi:hypothetical protein